jgi:hypothetical protein
MLELSSLNRAKTYLISGHPETWKYSQCRGGKYCFYSFGLPDVNRRKTLTLTAEQVQTQVWQEVRNLDLSNLEASEGL